MGRRTPVPGGRRARPPSGRRRARCGGRRPVRCRRMPVSRASRPASEIGPGRTPEERLLAAFDADPTRVVEDDRAHRGAGEDSRLELLHRLKEASVARDREDLSLGHRQLRTDGGGKLEAHRREAARRDVRPRGAGDPALLDHPLREAGAGHHDRVLAGRGLDLTDRPGHRHRRGRRARLELDLLEPGGLALGDLADVVAIRVDRATSTGT